MNPCGEISAEDLRTAVSIYVEEAYPGEKPRGLPDLATGAPIEDCLGVLKEETCAYEGAAHRWTLRLGCPSYAFMKMVLQEHLLPGRFFFGVDTHDQFVVPDHFPDAEAWRQVLERNRVLRQHIETRWEAAGLPTAATLRRELVARLGREGLRGEPRRAPPLARLLVADDDQDLLVCTSVLLREAGYEVHEAPDGQAAWELLEAQPFDLALVDYEMPRLDGLALIDRVRDRLGERAAMPVVLTTLARLPPQRTARASGLLPKPYARAGLLRAIESQLPSPRG